MGMRNMLGYISGNLKVVRLSNSRRNGVTWWTCFCLSCNNEIDVREYCLIRGQQCCKSCGLKKRNVTHGCSKKAIYKTWCLMIQRCEDKNIPIYKHYGGRGIKVCKRWRNSFEAFLNDMGDKPSPKHSIDRINVNKNYTPQNCRWVTFKQQASNKRNSLIISYNGEKMNLSNWATLYNISYDMLYQRIVRCGWDMQTALTKKSRKK